MLLMAQEEAFGSPVDPGPRTPIDGRLSSRMDLSLLPTLLLSKLSVSFSM